MNYFITKNPNQDLFGLKKIDLQEVVEKIKGLKAISVDIETTGLSMVDDKILMIQISTEKDNFVIDARCNDLKLLKPVLKSKKTVKIFHNGSFDVGFLVHNKLIVENVFCTMLAEKIIHCGKDNIRYSLKDVLWRYKGIEMDKEARNSFIGFDGDTFTEEQVIYGVEDTKHLIEIARRQVVEVRRLELETTLKLENNALLSFVDMSVEGMYVNPEKWRAVEVKSKEKASKLLEELNVMAINDFPKVVKVDMFGNSEVNWNSPKQVLSIFKEIIPSLESVGAPVVEPLAHKHQIISKYLEYKGAAKRMNAYGEKFLQLRHSDGKLHTHYSQILNTGRVSSSKPNLQQIPSEEDFRNCFESGKDGWVLVGADFASQELAIIAYASGEEEWLKILSEKGDLHSRCSELIFGEEFTKLKKDSPEWKKLRTYTKTITFGISYGMGAQSLAKRLKMSDMEAERLIARYFDTFPKVKRFLDSKANAGEDTGLIRTLPPFKRLRSFSKWNGVNTPKGEVGYIRRAAANTVIQGSAADQCKLALIYVRNAIKGTPIKMVLTVHDEILLTCPEEWGERCSDILEESMGKAGDSNLTKGLLTASATIMRQWEK